MAMPAIYDSDALASDPLTLTWSWDPSHLRESSADMGFGIFEEIVQDFLRGIPRVDLEVDFKPYMHPSKTVSPKGCF